jgi:hypothetical protein
MHLLIGPAVAIFGAVAAGCGYVTFQALRREGITPLTVLMLSLSTLIIVPYGFNYDMVMIAGALVVYLAGIKVIDLIAFVVLGLLWALPAIVMVIKGLPLPLPVSSGIMVVSLMYLHRVAQRSKSA